MRYALDAGGNVVRASEDLDRSGDYTCLDCGRELHLCLPYEQEPYFRHRNNESCLPVFSNWGRSSRSSNCNNAEGVNELEWHKTMKGYFDPSEREIIVSVEDEDHGKKEHIADVMIGNTVLEFQHSPITASGYLERTRFWVDQGKYVVWIFDASVLDIRKMKNNEGYRIKEVPKCLQQYVPFGGHPDVNTYLKAAFHQIPDYRERAGWYINAIRDLFTSYRVSVYLDMPSSRPGNHLVSIDEVFSTSPFEFDGKVKTMDWLINAIRENSDRDLIVRSEKPAVAFVTDIEALYGWTNEWGVMKCSVQLTYKTFNGSTEQELSFLVDGYEMNIVGGLSDVLEWFYSHKAIIPYYLQNRYSKDSRNYDDNPYRDPFHSGPREVIGVLTNYNNIDIDDSDFVKTSADSGWRNVSICSKKHF